nr:hypothetical protein CFP56_34747 [Quercus suber]
MSPTPPATCDAPPGPPAREKQGTCGVTPVFPSVAILPHHRRRRRCRRLPPLPCRPESRPLCPLSSCPAESLVSWLPGGSRCEPWVEEEHASGHIEAKVRHEIITKEFLPGPAQRPSSRSRSVANATSRYYACVFVIENPFNDEAVVLGSLDSSQVNIMLWRW